MRITNHSLAKHTNLVKHPTPGVNSLLFDLTAHT